MNPINFLLSFFCLYLVQKFTDSSASSPARRFNPGKEAIRFSGQFSNQEKEIINAVQELGRKISYAQWTKNPNANVVLSPLSITTILNLLMLGTDGQTNFELKNSLNYSRNLQENVIHETAERFLQSLHQSGSGVEISLNTRLFPQEGFPILNSYILTAGKSYFTEIQSLDFQRSPRDSTEEINRWVSNSTEGKIRQIFSEPLSPETVCVACNVIFLNATWENKFDSRLTRKGVFSTLRGNLTIPMMTSEMFIPFFRNKKENVEIVALPYKGNRYSMYIIKSTDNSGFSKLQQVESFLNPTNLNSLINQMKSRKVSVTIPRMRLSQDLDLEADLKSLGISQIFNENLADFGRFSNKRGIFVSNIFHKAILEVTEDGTTAAAVTISLISTTSLPERFILDKPSLLFIRDNEKGIILFWAKVLKPEPLTT